MPLESFHQALEAKIISAGSHHKKTDFGSHVKSIPTQLGQP